MELENTTVLSMLVGLAGFLAELIFHETLTSSVLGVILSIVLAAVVLMCTYFMIDGLMRSVAAMHKKEENRKREYDEKLYRLLDKKLTEQIKLEKGIYVMLAKSAKDKEDEKPDATVQREASRELAENINSNTLKAVKLLAKYHKKNLDETVQSFGQDSQELLQAVGRMENQLEAVSGKVEELAERPVVTSDAFASVEPKSVGNAEKVENAFTEAIPEVAEEIIEEPEEVVSEAVEEVVEQPVEESFTEMVEEVQEKPEESVSETVEEVIEKPMEEAVPEAAEKVVEEPVATGGMTALDMLLGKQQETKETILEPEAVPEAEPIMESATEETPVEPEPIPEPESSVQLELDLSNPNKELSPDEIAALFAAASETATASEAEEPPITEETKQSEELESIAEAESVVEPAPAIDTSDPNKMMSPDDIAALIASMNS